MNRRNAGVPRQDVNEAVLMITIVVARTIIARVLRRRTVVGVVSVASKRKTIQHLEGGIVDQIMVAEGDRVKAGQSLVRLDRTQAQANLERLRARHAAANALHSRLKAERDNTTPRAAVPLSQACEPCLSGPWESGRDAGS